MPDIFTFMRAVRGSNLPGLARHLLLNLASLAVPETGVIPERYSPSLTELSRQTGWSRSSVAEQLNRVETDGWVKRDRPTHDAARTKKERTRYTLVIPGPPAELVQEPDQPDPDEPDSVGPTAGLASPGAGPELVRQPDGASPPAGHEVPTSTSTSTTSPSERFAEESGAEVTGGKILKDWIDYCAAHDIQLPKRLIGHYAKEIKAALDEKFTERTIKQALAGMFRDNVTNRPSLLSNRLVSVQTGPERTNQQGRRSGSLGAYTPYRNPTDPDAYAGWKKARR